MALKLPLLTTRELEDVSEHHRRVIDYRRAGISLNHIIGCPIDCAYCVRHFEGNFEMKDAHRLCSDDEAVEQVLASPWFVRDATTIELLHKATDPFLPAVRPSTLYILEKLDALGLRNIVMVITREKVTADDVARLNRLRNLRMTLFFSYSGIRDKRIEPLSASGITERSIQTVAKLRANLKLIQHWRPIVPGWNDDEETISRVAEVSKYFDAVVYKGLRLRESSQKHMQARGIEIPYAAPEYRKLLERESEVRFLRLYEAANGPPLFKKTSCAVSYVHGVPDYNSQWGEPGLCDKCPESQRARCSSEPKREPSAGEVSQLLGALGKGKLVRIESATAWVSGLSAKDRLYLHQALRFPVASVD